MAELHLLCTQALQRPAGTPALEFEQRWIHWGQIRELAESLAALIDAAGVSPQAHIAFVPRNRPSAVAALLGLIARGRSVRMLYAFQSQEALARDIERLRPAVLVAAAEDCSAPVLAALSAQGSVAFALSEMGVTALPGLDRARQSSHPEPPASAPQIEILTSGTTSAPKRFAISHELVARHMVGTALTAGAGAPGADLAERPPLLLYMPLGNISGIYTTLPPLLRGQRVVLLDRFSIPAWHDYVLRYRPAFAGLPPSAVQAVLDAGIPAADLASLRYLGAGAAPLDPGVHRAFEQRYGIAILLSYGATEFGGPVAAMTADLHAAWGQAKFGSVGPAVAGVQMRIVDPASGAVLPPGQEGLLEVVSHRIGPDWIRTSDIAMIDADGFLFHRGRADGAILRGGFKLLPETIENALLLHPGVSSAAVVGVADHRLGQVPAATVVLKPGHQAGAAELEAHLRGHLLATHIPVHWRFVDALPTTPSLKIDRPALRQAFEAQAAA
jgi:acyl-coenzyme A synthetase/AMP-(fatty) acid ligase